MKISYTNKKLYSSLIIGILWIGLGIYFILLNEHPRYYFPLIFGVIFISIFVHQYLNKYVEIKDNEIKVNTFPAKAIAINRVNFIYSYGDDYIFKSSDKTLRISKSQINKEDLSKFESFFN